MRAAVAGQIWCLEGHSEYASKGQIPVSYLEPSYRMCVHNTSVLH